MEKSRYIEIDYLRAIALLLVLFRHVHYALPIFITDYPLILQGTWSGADLFFVISGFVITLSLYPIWLLYKQGEISFGKYLGSFFCKRVLRLLPLAIITLILNVTLAHIFNRSGQFGQVSDLHNEIIPILFYYYNYYVWYGGSTNMGWYWSLSIEEQFYFIYPLLLALLSHRSIQLAVFIITILAITFLIRPFTTPSFDHVRDSLWPSYTTPSHLRIDSILAGCAAAMVHIHHKAIIHQWLKKHLSFVRFLLIFCFLGIMFFGIVLPRYELTGYPSIMICSTVLVIIAAAGLPGFSKIPGRRILLWIGTKSYAIYLFHMVAIHIVNEIWFRCYGIEEKQLTITQGIVGLISALSLTAVFAEISFRWVESKGIRVGHRLAERILISHNTKDPYK